MARLAAGMANDLLATAVQLLAEGDPLPWWPAMNQAMWGYPFVPSGWLQSVYKADPQVRLWGPGGRPAGLR